MSSSPPTTDASNSGADAAEPQGPTQAQQQEISGTPPPPLYRPKEKEEGEGEEEGVREEKKGEGEQKEMKEEQKKEEKMEEEEEGKGEEGEGGGGGEEKEFRLRWNNYQTNLVRNTDSFFSHKAIVKKKHKLKNESISSAHFLQRSSFGQLLRTESFVDVTLSAGGRHLRAHRVVLSACSPYFRHLLSDCPGGDPAPCGAPAHPVVILPAEVSWRDLRRVVSYMYAGEVSVPEAEMPGMLRACEALGVRGLADLAADGRDKSGVSAQSNPTRRFRGSLRNATRFVYGHSFCPFHLMKWACCATFHDIHTIVSYIRHIYKAMS